MNELPDKPVDEETESELVDELSTDLPKSEVESESQSTDNSVMYTTEFSAKFVGPLPPPGILKGYEELYEGAAQIIFEQFVLEQEHRRKMEQKLVSLEESDRAQSDKSFTRGQWFGFIIAVLGIAGSLIAGVLGATITGSVVGGGTIVSLVAVFVSRKRFSKKKDVETEDRNEEPESLEENEHENQK